MPFIRQTNFLGGELSPLLWGRTDLDLFHRGLRRMRNFFPSRYGGAVSRPGTLDVGPTKSDGTAKRLIPFVYSDSESFAIEAGLTDLGHLYFRFHSNGATVTGQYLPFDTALGAFTVGLVVTGGTSGASGTIVGVIPRAAAGQFALQVSMNPGPAFIDNEPITDTDAGNALVDGALETRALEVVGGATLADLSLLRFAQVGAVLTMVHPDFPPQELRRLADVGNEKKWTLSNVLFKSALPYFASGYPVLGNAAAAPGVLPVVDATHPAKEWIYLCTLMVQDTATGRVFETMPWRIAESWTGVALDIPVTLADNQVALYPDQPVTIWRRNGVVQHLEADGAPGLITTPTEGLNVPQTSYRELAMNVYRGRATVFGLVGQTSGDFFLDEGAEPDFSVQPPLGTDPFLITDHLGATTSINPTAVGFFQERRCFAHGATLWCSEAGAYENFDRHVYQLAGESLLFELAARRLEEALHLVPHAKLLVHTRSSSWSFGGAVAGGALDFNSVDARLEDEVGSLDIAPVTIGGLVLIARAKGLGVRQLSFDGNGGYKGVEISEASAHLFKGQSNGYLGTPSSRRLVDWCYAEDPWGLVWAVRADGQLLSLSHNGDARGWARHDTNGWVQAVCSVPEGEEDAVYLLVKRPNQDYPFGDAYGPFGTAASFRVERMASRVRKGDATDDCCVDDAVQKTILQAVLALGVPPTITGLDHLYGHSVWVQGVGNAPYGPLPVQRVNIAGGMLMAPVWSYQVTLPEVPTPNSGGYSVPDVALYGERLHFGGDFLCYVGLAFTAELETLDVAEASVRTKAKITKAVGFELDESRGVLVGQNFDTLKALIKRARVDSYDAPVPATALFVTPVVGAWGLTGRAALRQPLPLPVTVVGLVREVDVGDA